MRSRLLTQFKWGLKDELGDHFNVPFQVVWNLKMTWHVEIILTWMNFGQKVIMIQCNVWHAINPPCFPKTTNVKNKKKQISLWNKKNVQMFLKWKTLSHSYMKLKHEQHCNGVEKKTLKIYKYEKTPFLPFDLIMG
jgi:hypothetical protein